MVDTYEPKHAPVDRATWDSIKDRFANTLFQKNRARFFQVMKEQVPTQEGDFALFKGANEVPLYSSDVSYPEYQEAFFYYLFGAKEMGCYGLLDFHAEKAILFIPRLDNLYKIWMNFEDKTQVAAKYEMLVFYVDEMESVLETYKGTCFVNEGKNSDSGLTTQTPEDSYLKNNKVDREVMHDWLSEARVIKNDEEIHALRWASQITAEAHCNVLRNVKPGMQES